MSKVAFLYATFPRPTETFVRRELRALEHIEFVPDLYSIWKGADEWEGKTINKFYFFKLFTLVFWIPYWAWKKPGAFREILRELWKNSCPGLQNWNETFLGLGFALVEAHRFKRKEYSLLHGVWATMPTTAALGLSELTDVPFSMGAHAYDVFRSGGDWLLDIKFKRALFVRTSSSSTASRILKLGVAERKIKLIRRGLANWPVRENFELCSNSHLELISVGRLVEKKGYIHQLRIAKFLLNQSIPFRLRIVGSGPLSNSLFLESKRMGLEGNIIFTGPKTQKETRELYLHSDIFLFTGVIAKNGDRDGIPNVVPEAMSAGCLILASCYAGASEAFVEDVSGFSINPFNTKDWVDLLVEFWQSPESFVKIRKSAIKHSKEAFNIERTANSFTNAVLNGNLK